MEERFCLRQDDDGHWYLFTVNEAGHFADLMEIDPHDFTAEEEDFLGSHRVDGPFGITFSKPETGE